MTAPPANGRPRGLLGSGVPEGAAGRAASGPAAPAPSGPAGPPPAGRRWRAAWDAAFRAAGCWLDRGIKAGRGCAVPLGVQGQVSGLAAPRVGFLAGPSGNAAHREGESEPETAETPGGFIRM